MSKKAYILLGGILVIVALGVATWFVFGENTTTVVENTTNDSTTEEVETVTTGTLAFQQGTVEVKVFGSEYAVVETDSIIRQGDSIKTGADSKAIIEIENGDIIRLGANSEITLSIMDDTQIAVLQKEGSVYNRVAKDQDRIFKVINGVVVVEALGTAFDVVDGDEKVDVTCVESKVKVTTDEEEEEVAQGKTATVSKADKKVALGDFDETKLENDWYTWNKEQDTQKKLALGALEKKTEEKKEEVTKEEETKTEEETKEEEKKEEETKTEEEKPEETTPTYTGPILNSPSERDEDIALFWSSRKDNPGFNYYKVLRSESGEPTYENNKLAAVSSENYGDASVKAGKTYYYRICAVGDEVLCGNTQKITVNNLENSKPTAVSLSGLMNGAGDTITLSWGKSSEKDFSAYKVVRSQTDSTPQYPEDGYLKALGQETLSYTDTTDIFS